MRICRRVNMYKNFIEQKYAILTTIIPFLEAIIRFFDRLFSLTFEGFN